MTDLVEIDYFSDAATAQDPYAYWEALRSEGPVVREPHHGVVAVTGYAEVMAAFKDVDSFSAVNAIGGPFPPLPFEPNRRRHRGADRGTSPPVPDIRAPGGHGSAGA